MPTYAKAIAAFILNALGGLAVVLTGPAASFGDITDGQWVALAASSVGAALAVYGIRNGLSGDATTSTPQVKPRDTGSAELWIIAGALVVIALVLVLGRP